MYSGGRRRVFRVSGNLVVKVDVQLRLPTVSSLVSVFVFGVCWR